MDKLRLGVLALTTVCAWAFATGFFPNSVWNFGWLPPDAWRVAAHTLVGAVLAYPLAHALGLPDATYVRVAVVTTVVAAIVESAVGAHKQGLEWLPIAFLLCAAVGILVKKARRPRTA